MGLDRVAVVTCLLLPETDHHGFADDYPANFDSCAVQIHPPEKREYQWAITLIRQRGKFLGCVAAPRSGERDYLVGK